MSELIPIRMNPGRAKTASDRMLLRLTRHCNGNNGCLADQAQSVGGKDGGGKPPAPPETMERAAGTSGPQAARIRIDVPMGTPYQEIQTSIFLQAYQHAGTQLRAAVALGITPDTVSRVLRRSEQWRASLCKPSNRHGTEQPEGAE